MNDLAITAMPNVNKRASIGDKCGASLGFVPQFSKGFNLPMDDQLFGNRFAMACRFAVACQLCMASVLILSWFAGTVVADEPKIEKYSPEVVAKAEKILKQCSLRRSGKQIQATGTTSITRGITGLAREKRELRLLQKDWDSGGLRLNVLRQQLQQLKQQRAELSLQLARVAGDTAANNRVVGLLNVNNNQMGQVVAEREKTKASMTAKRAVLSEAESKYAERILAIRKQFTLVETTVREALTDNQVAIALQVMHVNFETPANLTSDQVLASLNKRVERVEQEVFSETIPLQVENRSMYVNVVVGNKTTRMVVDSGASLICLPARIAAELGIVISPDAPQMELVVANGDRISARGVVLPRVRIGEFEVENVDAAVLEAAADAAEPLLGMSFLDHFKFEINAADRSLKMLRVKTE
ncbi:retroviral-like aspartic protease family protein [bacterium]|nr:retroviral-like aspartic protease family protein [bacterium]